MNSNVFKFIYFIYIILIFEVIACTHLSSQQDNDNNKHMQFTLDHPPVWGITQSGTSILAGGFSGLLYLGKNPKNDEFQFLTHSDRGPNGEPKDISKLGKNLRPFFLPEFQLRWVKLETNHKNMTLSIVEEILLTNPDDKPISGLAQITPKDETSINLEDQILPDDPMGIDPESIAIDSDGNFWMGEEYRPSILKFSSKGKLLKRFVPKNSLPQTLIKKINKHYGQNIVVDHLPEAYKYRKSNRGFEGLTFLNGKIYAMAQSPLELPKALHQKVIRILEFDIKSEVPTAEYFYPLSHEGLDKIGDLTINPGSSEFFVIEQNSKIGKSGIHLISSFFLNRKSKIRDPELKSMDFLKSEQALLDVQTRLDLSLVGFDFAEKVEGLTFISEKEIAVINDNDFGVAGQLDTKKKSVIGIFEIKPIDK